MTKIYGLTTGYSERRKNDSRKLTRSAVDEGSCKPSPLSLYYFGSVVHTATLFSAHPRDCPRFSCRQAPIFPFFFRPDCSSAMALLVSCHLFSSASLWRGAVPCVSSVHWVDLQVLAFWRLGSNPLDFPCSLPVTSSRKVLFFLFLK